MPYRKLKHLWIVAFISDSVFCLDKKSDTRLRKNRLTVRRFNVAKVG